ncbi:type II toxin-antitoxin system RelE/ParE family toxin [Stackebrandtia albiflava]|uniref:type II toxin-antitoxin system RelE/ParE family toxin n=1 Tax=Stackebrandtia albiflava TaxID=406432 RepID=UPI002452C8A2|nr:type II toxin-antitoxin system RelE/ParE family toxin [Stackebrandtia albiflava]
MDDLKENDRESYRLVTSALERLEDVGPVLRRPTVGTIEGSAFRNMRELRPRSGSRVSIRMLFVFDPKRRAVFLVAGDKAEEGQWSNWYRKAIPEADERYTAYLEAMEMEEAS